MVDNPQLPPPDGRSGRTSLAPPPGPRAGRVVLVTVLLIAAGAILGLIGGLIWAAAAPRVVYQVATLSPPTAYAVNPETSAFIAADGIYSIIAVLGGALLGLAGYVLGVRRYGLAPLLGVVAGAIVASFLAEWIGNVQTGGQSFDSVLASSKRYELLRAPISLGAHGAMAFWPVAAALVAGGLELLSLMQARRSARGQRGMQYQPPPPPPPFQPPGATASQPLWRDGSAPAEAPQSAGPASSAQPWPASPPGAPDTQE
jgi:hypothetical protein